MGAGGVLESSRWMAGLGPAWNRKTCFQHWLLSVKMATPGSGVGRGEGCIPLVNSKREQLCEQETTIFLLNNVSCEGFEFCCPWVSYGFLHVNRRVKWNHPWTCSLLYSKVENPLWNSIQLISIQLVSVVKETEIICIFSISANCHEKEDKPNISSAANFKTLLLQMQCENQTNSGVLAMSDFWKLVLVGLILYLVVAS